MAVKATRAHEINALVRIAKISIVRVIRIRISCLASQMINIATVSKITLVLDTVSLGIEFRTIPTNLTRIRASWILEVARRRPKTRIETENNLELESS